VNNVLEMSEKKAPDTPNDVFIRVFLNSDMRTRFKVACAQSGVAMSERARKLIEEWVVEWEQQKQTSAKGGDDE
jgi:hypothetical protein